MIEQPLFKFSGRLLTGLPGLEKKQIGSWSSVGATLNDALDILNTALGNNADPLVGHYFYELQDAQVVV